MSSILPHATALGVLAFLVLNGGELRGQTYQDSLSIASVIFGRFEGIGIRELPSGAKCGDPACTPEQIVADWRRLYGEHSHPSGDPPPCRAEQGAGHGSRLSFERLTIGPVSAIVFVGHECTNPPGRAHRLFATAVELFLEKRDGRWEVVGEGLRVIT